MEDFSASSNFLGILPPEMVCEIISSLDLRDLIAFRTGSRRAYELVQDCLTRLRVGEKGRKVPGSFVLSLPRLGFVEGLIEISSIPELRAVSRKLEESLQVVGTNLRDSL